MTGVFVKLSELLRYCEGDSILEIFAKGEKYYYDQLVVCSAITHMSKDKIGIFGLIDSDVPGIRHSPLCEVTGTLKISETGEFLIEEFKCLTCNDSKCEHVAGLLLFLNRHNLNKSQRIKPKDLQKTRESIIDSHFHPKTLNQLIQAGHFGEKCRKRLEKNEEFKRNLPALPADTSENLRKLMEAIYNHRNDTAATAEAQTFNLGGLDAAGSSSNEMAGGQSAGRNKASTSPAQRQPQTSTKRRTSKSSVTATSKVAAAKAKRRKTLSKKK